MKASRFLLALPLALMLFAAPVRADQSTIVGPIVGPKTMAEVMGTINSALLAIQSCNSGSSAPANGVGSLPTTYQCWIDTTTNPQLYKIYDGTGWVTLGSLNTSTHVWLPYMTGGTSGGVPFIGTGGAMGSSGLLAQYGFMVGGGTGAAPATITACSDDQIAFGRTSNSPLCRTVTGDITFATGVAAIGTAKVTSAMLRNSGALSLIGRSANSGGVPGDISATAASDAVLRESGSVLGFGTVATGGIANNAITDAKLRQGLARSIIGVTGNAGANVADIQGATDQILRVNGAGTVLGFGSIDLSKSAAVGSSILAQANGGTGIAALGTGVAVALGVNIGSAGAPVLFNGAGGTPSSMTATNLSGTASGLTAGNVTTNANLTGDVTSVGNATTLTNAPVIAKLLTGFASNTGTITSSDSILTAMQKLYGNDALKASISSPTFTGTPAAPTATPGASTTQVATTAFVTNAVTAATTGVASYNTRTGAVTAVGTDVPLRSYLAGLTLSTAGSSATFGIAAGVATDSTNVSMMALASAYTKTTSSWALGTAAGALDTGSVANSTWYHVHLIQRPDTGIVDVLISLSATSPTMPANYTLFRRIGSMKTNGSAQWVKFIQIWNRFRWDVPVLDVSATSFTSTYTNQTISVPTGVQVLAFGNITSGTGGSISNIRPPGTSDGTPATTVSPLAINGVGSGGDRTWSPWQEFTNTSAQISIGGNTTINTYLTTAGWEDARGKND